MKKSTVLLVLLTVFLAFGYRTNVTLDSGTGKIYVVDNMLLRTDPNANAIVVYDITNPYAHQTVKTIELEGNSDIAVASHYMYVDSYRDLIIYDVADWKNPVPVDTLRNVFQYMPTIQDDWNTPPQDWNNGSSGGGGFMGCGGCMSEQPVAATVAARDNASGGKGGSMARFAILGDRLYMVDNAQLYVYDISNPARPQYRNAESIGWTIETIFPRANQLFIGGQNGMYIYDVSEHDQPRMESEFTHRTACDPVVVEGNRAYVTLRAGSRCGDNSNQMDILDITNTSNPQLISTVPLENPYGLAVHGNTAFVCDGNGGLKVLDVSDPHHARQISQVTGITPYDAILKDNTLIVTAEDGLYIYDVSKLGEPVRAGQIH